MKKFSLIISVLALVMGLSQCQKRPNAPMMYCGHTQDITFSTNGGNCAKGDFEQVQEGLQYVLKYKWNKESDNDVLHVYAQYGGDQFVNGNYLGKLSLNKVTNGGYDAEFKGTLDGVPDEGWLRFVHYGHAVDVNAIGETGVTVDFSEQDGSLATISDKVVAVCDQKIDNGFKFEGCQLNVQFAAAKVDLSDFEGDVDVSCILENGITVSKYGEIGYVPAAHSTLKGISDCYYVVLMPLDDTKPIKFCDGKKLGKIQHEFAGNGYYSKEGDAYKIEASALTEGSIKGECYTVGPRESAHFSNGTLQWTAEGTHAVADGTGKGTWRLAEHQWDFIGGDNIKIYGEFPYSSAPVSGFYMDLFGFGTSGYNEQAPYKHSYVSSDYGYGQNDIAGTNYDWGVYNAISNAGNQPGLWRTPTNDEWVHLAKGRNNNPAYNSVGKFMAGVGTLTLSDETTTVNGMFILPDKYYTKPEHRDFTSDNGWTLTEEELCDYSIVFSPCGGYRAYNTEDSEYLGYMEIDDYPIKGYFHSSSARVGNDGWNYEQAYLIEQTMPEETEYIYFGLDDHRRHLGFFVRLVCE